MTFNPRVVSLMAGFALTATAAFAQQTQGDFLVTAPARANANTNGGLFHVGALGGTVTNLGATGPLADSYSIAADPYDDSCYWVGTTTTNATSSPAIYKVRSIAGKILSTTKLNVALLPADKIVHQIRPFGLELLFLTNTQFSAVPVSGGKIRTIQTFSSGTATNFACDGRNVFVQKQPTQAILAEHITRFDLQFPANETLIYQTGGITYFMPGLTLDDQDNLLITEIEAFSGVANLKQLDTNGKTLRTFRLPFTHGVADARMDPAGGTIVVAGRRYDTANKRQISGIITLLNWTMFKTEFGTTPEFYSRIDVRRHEPIHRYGHVCESQTKWRAEISAQGLPAVGNSNYKIAVKGLPNQPVMLLIGVHGAVTTPFPLAAIGAGTCELGVLPTLSLGFRLDAAGSLVLPAPIAPGTQAVNLDVQWLLAEPTANLAGFVSSQVGSITVR